MHTISNLITRYLKSISTFSLIFIFFNNSIIAQSNQSFEWEKELSQAKGQNRVDIILKISTELIKENLTITDSLAREGITLSKQLGDSLSMHRLGTNIGRVFYYQDEIDKGFEWTQKSLDYFKQDQNLAFDKAKLQLFLADLYIKRRAYIKAENLLSKSKSYFESVGDSLWLGEIAHSKGIMNYGKKEFKEALDYFSKTLKIGERLENKELIAMAKNNIGLINIRHGFYPDALAMLLKVYPMKTSNLVKAQCYSNIGKIYGSLKDWESSMKYMQMGLELEKKIGLENGIWKSLKNIGIVHKKQMNFGEAMKYFERSLAIQRKRNLYPGSLLSTMGNVYNQLGQPEKANEYFDEYKKLAEVNNDWEAMWGINYNLGQYALHTKQYDEALKLFLKSYDIAQEKKNLRILILNNEGLSEVYDSLGNEEKAKFHREEYAIYNNSINNIPKDEIIKALEQMHKPELQKDSIDSISQRKNLGNQRKDLLSKKNILLGITLLMLFSFTFFYFRWNQKKEYVPLQDKSLNQTKIDHYFKELFTRLDQNKINSESNNNTSLHQNITPINDMTEFLRDNLSTPNDWVSFEQYFEKVHKDFFKNLKFNHPTISTNELNMCALLKLNLRNKDIAHIMGISPGSVRKAQNRLSKKLELSSDEVLRDFVIKL
ncbi:MAG: tetratricopeptide repeat protein [Saprospiraceae bacterium]